MSGQGDVLAQLSYFYDAEGRLSQIQKNGETAQTREYDGDNVTHIADAQGNTTGFDYSSLGELLAITQPDGNATRLAYDAKQNLNTVTDARQNETRYQYNDLGQLIVQHSPDTGITRYAYDAAGNQTAKTDAAGHTTTYTYDAANRVTLRHDNDGTTRYQYDPTNGRLSQVSDKTSTETFAYNRDAQLIEHTRQIDTLSFSTTYAYTTQGKLVRKALHDGQLLKYHYHDDGPKKGTLRAITRDNLIGQTTIIGELNTHDTATQAHWQHGNGVAVNKQTDGLGNPVAYSFSKALSLTYSYDDAGRINGIERNGQLNWYDYDTSGQLIGADTSLGRFEYDYDEVGNRTQKTHSQDGRTEQTNYAFASEGSGNRLLDINGEARDYNVQGNPTETETLRYEYNAQQRPIKVYKKDSNALIAEYTYNSFGARIKKVAYSSNAKKYKTVTYYLYDGRKLAAEVNQDGKVTAQYVYYKDQPVAKLQRRDIYAIHADHLGTPQTVTNQNQEVVWQAEYTPFGEATIQEQQITLNLRLPGQYFDKETGTHYNYYRDYDPQTGRYAQSDPIGLLGGVNTYAYVGGNPISYADSLGLFLDTGAAPVTRTLVRRGLIGAASTVAGPVAIGALVGAYIAYEGISSRADEGYITSPEAEDFAYLVSEIQTYDSSFHAPNVLTEWSEFQDLSNQLYRLQLDYIQQFSNVCSPAFDQNLFDKARDAITFRESITTGLYGDDKTLIDQVITQAFEDYRANGGDLNLSQEDWLALGMPNPDGSTGPGSPGHKANRWQDYQARGGKWNYRRWSNVYDANMERARNATAIENAYHDQLGWGQREVTVEEIGLNNLTRRLDIADLKNQRAVEVKSGYTTRNAEVRSELERDGLLVEDGWDVHWHFDGTPSRPLLDALEEVGISWSVRDPSSIRDR